MALSEVSRKYYKPVIHIDNRSFRTSIPGIFGASKSVAVLLDRVIAHAEMVGTIASHNPVERKITLPAEGTIGGFLVDVFKKTKSLKAPEHRRKKIRRRFKYIQTSIGPQQLP